MIVLETKTIPSKAGFNRTIFIQLSPTIIHTINYDVVLRVSATHNLGITFTRPIIIFLRGHLLHSESRIN